MCRAFVEKVTDFEHFAAVHCPDRLERRLVAMVLRNLDNRKGVVVIGRDVLARAVHEDIEEESEYSFTSEEEYPSPASTSENDQSERAATSASEPEERAQEESLFVGSLPFLVTEGSTRWHSE